MRVISGRFKGKRLKTVKGQKIRPTSDKLKAAMFNVLFSLGAGGSFDDDIILDIFSGSGALGIEALSRGARRCYFIDKDRDAVDVIMSNLKAVGAEPDSYRIIDQDFRAAFMKLTDDKVKFDIIFTDPPYKNSLTTEVIENINNSRIFKAGTVIVSEHSSDEVLPEEIGSFSRAVEKLYGDKVLSFYLHD